MKKKNNGANTFSLNKKKEKADRFVHFLWGVEIFIIPWGAMECSMGNLHLISAYYICSKVGFVKNKLYLKISVLCATDTHHA